MWDASTDLAKRDLFDVECHHFLESLMKKQHPKNKK